MNTEELKKIIEGITNWRVLEIIRDLCIKRLEEEFDILVPFEDYFKEEL